MCFTNHMISTTGVEPEPFELGEHLVEASEKLVVIDKLLKYLKTAGHKVLMFSQMTHMLDILQDYLGYRGQKFFLQHLISQGIVMHLVVKSALHSG